MRLEAAFTASIYLLVLTGLVTLTIAEGSLFPLALGPAFALGACFRTEIRKRPLGRLPLRIALTGIVLLTPVDFLWTGEVILTLVHFLSAAQVLKLYGEKRARDHMLLIVISLIQLGVAAIFTIDLSFSIGFFTYMVVSTWTLVLFLRGREIERRAPHELKLLRVGRRAFATLLLVTFSTLASTAVLFVFFPRFSAILYRFPHRRPVRMTGFSDRINLTDLSNILENETDVMRVQIERRGRGFPDRPRWRALAYDRYEDHQWSRSWANTTGGRLWSRATTSGGGKRWRTSPRSAPIPSENAISIYSVTLAPTGTAVLFTVPDALDVTFISAARPDAVYADRRGGVLASTPLVTNVRYRVRSHTQPDRVALWPPEQGRSALPTGPQSDSTRRGAIHDLDLPDDTALRDALHALTNEVAASANASGAPAHARALESYLADGPFTYTTALTDTTAPAGTDPIAHFLFDTRTGHCELYATSFVLLARASGIRARLVTGFQAGEWNEFGNFYHVRQSDAHAWATCWIDGRWIDFDPTPRGDPDGGVGLWATVGRMLESIRMRWLNYVVGYSLADQMSFAETLRQRSERAWRKLRRWSKGVLAALQRTQDLWIRVFTCAGAVGLTVLAALLGWRLRRSRQRRSRKGQSTPCPVPFYEALIVLLGRLGYERSPSETPLEFATRVARPGPPPLGRAQEVVEAFYAVRYGGQALSAARAGAVEDALAAIRLLANGGSKQPTAPSP